MTETEWLAAKSPHLMFNFLGRTLSPRKLRLVGIACCRRLRSLMAIEECCEAVMLAERLVEGEATTEEVALLREQMKTEYLALNQRKRHTRMWCVGAARNLLQDDDSYLRGDPIWAGDADLLRAYASASSSVTNERKHDENHQAQAGLLRDIIGNPFRPVVADPSWLTSDVIALAQGIYEDRAFDRMPILADALQDAGCDNEDVLSHCRQPGEHVRGCWAVDLILGKS